MEQGLIDIKNKAMKVAQRNDDTTPYLISCGTLLKLIQEVERREAGTKCVVIGPHTIHGLSESQVCEVRAVFDRNHLGYEVK
jgi:hypothetical protein